MRKRKEERRTNNYVGGLAKIGEVSNKSPVAWFNEENTAREYLDYLATIGVEADLHYNETAVFADYSAESDWFGVPIKQS